MTPLLKPAQAADILGVCEKTLAKLRRNGLPYVMITDSTVRYRREHLRDFMNGIPFEPKPNEAKRSDPIPRGPKGLQPTPGQVRKFEDVVPKRKRNSKKKRRSISFELRNRIFRRDGEKCAYCGTETPPFHLDHIYPVSRGGANHEDNLTVACGPCNFSKRDKLLEDWLAER